MTRIVWILVLALIGTACTPTTVEPTRTSIQEPTTVEEPTAIFDFGEEPGPTSASDAPQLTDEQAAAVLEFELAHKPPLPDFDQIARSDGIAEACEAWVWSEYKYDLRIDTYREESFSQSFNLDYVLADALRDFADCITLGWRDYKEYLQCLSKVKPREIEIDDGFTFLDSSPTETDRERCRAEATSFSQR